MIEQRTDETRGATGITGEQTREETKGEDTDETEAGTEGTCKPADATEANDTGDGKTGGSAEKTDGLAGRTEGGPPEDAGAVEWLLWWSWLGLLSERGRWTRRGGERRSAREKGGVGSRGPEGEMLKLEDRLGERKVGRTGEEGQEEGNAGLSRQASKLEFMPRT